MFDEPFSKLPIFHPHKIDHRHGAQRRGSCMATLSFKGKTFVQNFHFAVKYHQLEGLKAKSLTKKVTLHDNLVVHGDNLIALKALLPTYGGRVDCIYIDPPYNTGNEHWVYSDRVNSPMIKEWLGKVVDKDDLTRHDKWLCMMTPRLKILREFLNEDGVIFVSIDSNELHHLKMLMDEIFNEENYRDTLVIRRGVKSVQAQFETINSLSNGYESILMYSKNPGRRFNKIYEMLEEEKPGGWNNHWRGTDRPSMRYKLFGIKPKSGQWRWGEERSLQAVKNYKTLLKDLKKKKLPVTQENVDKWYLAYLEENEEDELDLLRLSENKKPEHYVAPTAKKLLSNMWVDLKPNGSSQLKAIFGKKVFDNPKLIDLVKRMLEFVTTKKNAIILDSFAGSGTTGHAVLDLNADDDGVRQFVLVECEEYADNITAERLRRVLRGIKKSKNQRLRQGVKGSFSYFKLGDPIELESILEGKNLPSFIELARYVFYTATGDQFIPERVDEKHFFIGESEEYQVYMVYKPDVEFLKTAALTLDLAEKLGKRNSKRRLVFAPSKYLDSDHLAELRIDFCQLPFEIYRG